MPTIHFSLAPSPLGTLFLAGTSAGVCGVSLGDEPGEAWLRSRYPKADLQRDDNALSEWRQVILAHLDGQLPKLRLPTDVPATPFQRSVWAALQAIPWGETRTYTQVAVGLGRPSAVRAVARACATNPTALIVPCHRVIRGNGDLAGFRWGIDRKRQLLARERLTSGDVSPCSPC